MMRFPRPGSWYRFTPTDWQFILDTLALTEKSREGLATLCDDPHAMQAVLDHPKLFEAVCLNRRAAMLSPELFFFVAVRHTLKRIGVEEIEVADYIAVVCAEFGLSPNIQQEPPQNASNSMLYSIDYMEALEKARGPEKFFIHVQCANKFLVLTCLFPTYLNHRSERRGAPDVAYYEKVVMNQFGAAGKHVLAEEFALSNVLTRLAESFPPVRRAMNHTLREYLHLGS